MVIIGIGCSFKFPVNVDVEDSIVNAPFVKNVRFKQLIRDP
jgi:hypothetical protein